MWKWAALSVITLGVSMLAATDSSRFRTFVVKMDEYSKLNAEQAQVIAEYKNTTDALKQADEEKTVIIEDLNRTMELLTNRMSDGFQALNKSECFHQTKPEGGSQMFFYLLQVAVKESTKFLFNRKKPGQRISY